MTRSAKIQMDPRTNGAVVFENMETSVPGQDTGDGDLLHLAGGHMLPLELAEDVFPVLHLRTP